MKDYFWGLITGVLLTLAVSLAVLIGFFRGNFLQRGILSEPDVVSKVNAMEDLIDRYYLNEPEDRLLAEGLYTGLVYGLGDPYSRYYTAEDYEEELHLSEGNYRGIGVMLSKETDGPLLVIECYPDTPAEAAGILSGDRILEIDGTDTALLSLNEAVAMVKESAADGVVLKIRTSDEEIREVNVELSSVDIPSVNARMLEDGIGYIRILEFTGKTPEQYKKEYSSLSEEGMQALVIDLRNNPGGRLDSVCDVLRQILPEGLIVYEEDKYGNREEETCNGRNRIDIPLAVLINAGSASASEIFAGAVKDYKVGTLVGETTYGKGIVQTIRSFTDGSAIKLTTSHYYTPLGNDIHGVGIEPDIKVSAESESPAGTEDSDDDPVLQKAVEILLSEKD